MQEIVSPHINICLEIRQMIRQLYSTVVSLHKFRENLY